MFFIPKLEVLNSLLFSITMVLIFNKLILSCNGSTTSSLTWPDQIDFGRTTKFFEENCKCPTNFQCECCAKVDNELFNIHQALCIDWAIFLNFSSVRTNVRLHENVIYTNTFSIWDIPPFCVPIWPAIALTGCIKVHSIVQHEDYSFHGCANATINFISFNILNFRIACLDISAGGIHFVEPNHPPIITTSTEKAPKLNLEMMDLKKHPTPALRNVELNDDVKSLIYLPWRNLTSDQNRSNFL